LRKDALADRSAKGPQTLDVGNSKYEFDAEGKLKGERLATDPRYVKLGDKVSAQQENTTVATAKAAASVSRDLSQMARFPTGTENSPFMHITDHDFLSSVQKLGNNIATPEQVQMFQTSSAGLSTELARVLTLGAGRGANQSVINEIKTFTTPMAGDTNLEAAYKMATAAQMAKTVIENSPEPNDQSVREGWQKTKSQLDAFPTPEQILNAASGSQRKQLSTMSGTYNQLLNKVQDAVTSNSTEPLPGGSDAGDGNSAPPLPAGWTVTEH